MVVDSAGFLDDFLRAELEAAYEVHQQERDEVNST